MLELLYFVYTFINILNLILFLFCMPGVPGVISLSHPREYITSPPPWRLLSSFNPRLPRPFTSTRLGIPGRSQIAADIAGHMDGQPPQNSLTNSSLEQII